MLLFWREDYFPEASGTDDAGAAIWVNCFGLHRKMSSSKQCKLIEDKLDIFFYKLLDMLSAHNWPWRWPAAMLL